MVLVASPYFGASITFKPYHTCTLSVFGSFSKRPEFVRVPPLRKVERPEIGVPSFEPSFWALRVFLRGLGPQSLCLEIQLLKSSGAELPSGWSVWCSLSERVREEDGEADHQSVDAQ